MRHRGRLNGDKDADFYDLIEPENKSYLDRVVFELPQNVYFIMVPKSIRVHTNLLQKLCQV